MGKGSCLLGFATMGVQAIRSAIGCLCCMIILGPLLMIIGFVMLVSPNNYADNVKKWNSEVANYTKETVPLIQKTVVEFPAVNNTLSTTTTLVKPTGNEKDVTSDSNSVHWTTSGNYDMNSNNLLLTVKSSGFAPTAQTDTSSAWQIAGGTTSSSSSSSWSAESHTIRVECTDDNGCTASDIRTKCASQYTKSKHYTCDSSDMYYPGGRVYENNYATCTYYTYIKSFCTPLKLQVSPMKWVRDSSKSSCDYPFTSQGRECSSSSSHSTYVPFTFRASNDPYITLSQITEGSMSFGLTELQQRLIGVAMMVIGALFIACMIGMCVAMRHLFCGDKHEHKAAVYGAFGRQYSYPQGYQQMPPQQQQGQQGMYAQQLPQQNIQGAYAQPPAPGYGQASPQGSPYGQPPQNYGQQPPAPGYAQPINQQQDQGAWGKQSAPMPSGV